MTPLFFDQIFSGPKRSIYDLGDRQNKIDHGIYYKRRKPNF